MNSSALESLYQEEVYALRSSVLVILPKPWTEVSEEEQILLSKILSSVILSLASVQIVVFRAFDLPDLEAYAPEQIISFGATYTREPGLYQVHTVNGASVLLADSLPNLDDVRKKSLWVALRQMFIR